MTAAMILVHAIAVTVPRVRRFSLRTLLIAVALVSIRDWMHISTAKSTLQATLASWEAGRAKHDEVIAASRALMQAESESIWMSRQTAVAEHVSRMKTLLDITEAKKLTTLGSERSMAKWCQLIRAEIDHHASNGP
jgi:hypothetical protein